MKFEKELYNLQSSLSSADNKNYFHGQKSRFLENFKIIKKYLNKDNKILEVGTYPSYFLAILKRCGYNIEGLDLNPEREKIFLEKENLIVKKCNIEEEKFPYQDNSFDTIILGEVFEHLYVNPIFAMKEIKRVLKKNGTLILTTPNGYSVKRIYNFIIGRGASENPFNEFNKINTAGHRGHIREYCASELIDFSKKIGLSYEGIEYVSFIHFGLSKNKLLKNTVNLIYYLFPKFRSHLVLFFKK